MITVISPHLDDAVLSLGQFLAATKATVVTVFAGIPTEGLSDYDKSCGFTSSAQAMETRRREDRHACESLGADVVHLDFLDNQYDQPADDGVLTEAIGQFLKPDWVVFVPLGLGHPDHRQVASCARDACQEGTLFAYEELPSRVLWPEQVVDEIDNIEAEQFKIADLPYPLELGSREAKVAAIAEYHSQFPHGADDPCLLVPERAWRIARCEN